VSILSEASTPIAHRGADAPCRRVAIVSDWFLPRRGGLELQMADLARSLRARGHQVEVITTWPGPAEIEGVTVRRLGGFRIPYVGVLASPEPFRELAGLIDSKRYDTVHVHAGIVAPFAYGAAWLCARLGVPTVVTFHSVYDYLRLGLQALAFAGKARDLPIFWSAVSKRAASDVEHALGTTGITILPNAIDISAWHGSSAPRIGAEFHVVSVMRFHVRKRPRALLRIVEAAQRLVGPSTTFSLDIIGDGEERGAIERLSTQMPNVRVRLHGWQSHDQIRRVFTESHAFVIPSRLESFGLAALEAACAGLPVIARSSTGIEDFIVDEAHGFLCDSDDAMARSLARLAGNESLRAGIAARNAATAWPYDWSDLTLRVEDCYEAATIRTKTR
jgi:glycosyltransferase involved in cell wall biosynthesis